jgi:hypothetical protein
MPIGALPVAWIAAAIIMAVGAAAFTAARQAEFSASVEVVPAAVGPLPAVHDAGYYRSLLRDPQLVRQAQEAIGFGASVRHDVMIAPSRVRPTFVVTATRPTPDGARDVANAVAHEIAYASGREVGAAAAQRLGGVEAQLGSGPVGPRQRRRLRGQAAALRKLTRIPAERVALGGPATAPPVSDLPDRLVDALPGPFPGRPSPFWAGLAGLLVTALLWVASAMLVSPHGIGSHDRLRRLRP